MINVKANLERSLVEKWVQRLLNKEKNKYYSKLNRRRKKEYVAELEQKIEELEQRVLLLTDQLNLYKNKMFSLASGQEKEFTDYFDSKDQLQKGFIEESLHVSNEEGFEKF